MKEQVVGWETQRDIRAGDIVHSHNEKAHFSLLVCDGTARSWNYAERKQMVTRNLSMLVVSDPIEFKALEERCVCVLVVANGVIGWIRVVDMSGRTPDGYLIKMTHENCQI